LALAFNIRLRIGGLFLGCVAPAVGGPVDDLAAWLKLDRSSRPSLESQPFSRVPLTAAESEQARKSVWEERTAYVKAAWGTQWTGKRLVDAKGLQMRFDYKTYGAKPADGYDLYISMHGGGEAAASVNDQQWQNQITLYQPPGIYLAPRAPTDTWNMWFQDHIDGFFDRIIQLCVANLDVNPNRVYIMGYSAGGDGAYQLGPRMADRWAAGAMMAGHPNDASPVNLRNIGFTLHVGGLDAAFDRNAKVVEFGKKIQALQDADPGFYRYHAQVHAGKPHWMDLEDKVALPWMAAFTRSPHPSKVVWLQDGIGIRTQPQSYWVGRPDRKDSLVKASITAEIKGQEVHVTNANLDSVAVYLNDSLVDLDKPVAFFWKGAKVGEAIMPRTAANLYASSEARGDREYIHPVRLVISGRGVGVSIGNHTGGLGTFHVTRNAGSFLISFGGRARSGSARLVDVSGALLESVAFSHRTEVAISARAQGQGLGFVILSMEGEIQTRALVLEGTRE
jgi:hypothetical protein